MMPSLIVGPTESGRDRFRTDLLALAAEARGRSQDALDQDHLEQSVIYLRFAEYIERLVASGEEQRYLPSRRSGRSG